MFYNKYQLISLSLDTYLKDAFVMLIKQIQTHFYTNDNSIRFFENFCQKIRLFFKVPEWEHLNFIKW